jgi:hypothetical protein
MIVLAMSVVLLVLIRTVFGYLCDFTWSNKTVE